MERLNHLKEYFTEEGIKSLEHKLSELVKLYVKEVDYPIEFIMYGFGDIVLLDKQHHKGRIDELRNILLIDEVEM